ncbi:Phenylalanyl-tRNA synthetase [Tyrophagus putrescentiae]|nr:Phenylalanyl-tRNA synthetase [Tyrophagus putrescentiae]
MAIFNGGRRGLQQLLKTNCSAAAFLFPSRSWSSVWSCAPPKSNLLLQTPPQLLQPRRSKFKRVGEHRLPGTELQILGARYRTDEWTNLPEKVLDLIGTELYRRPGNPIYLVAESLRRHYRHHRVHHFPDPVVTTWANFDSILVPARSHLPQPNGHLLRRPGPRPARAHLRPPAPVLRAVLQGW